MYGKQHDGRQHPRLFGNYIKVNIETFQLKDKIGGMC